MNTTVFLIIFLSAFGLLILLSVLSHHLDSAGVSTTVSLGSSGADVIKVVSFVLFLVLGFSIFPLAIRVFVFLQIKIGNAELFLVRFLQAHERAVVYGIWGLFVIALCFLVPIGIKDGDFK